MNMKKNAAKKSAPKKKGFFRAAGEVFGSIGHGLMEGKDKVVEMSQTVIEGISNSIVPAKKKASAKKVKKTAKTVAPKKAAKKVAKKTAAKKGVRKATKK